MKFSKGWVGCIGAVALMLAGCDKGTNGGGTPVSESDMVGVWALISMQEKGTETTTAPGQAPVTETKDTTTTYPANFATMEFSANKTFTMTQGLTMTGTWSVSGSQVTTITTLPFFNIKDTAIMEVILNGKEGTFVETEKGTEEFLGMKTEKNMVTTIKATKK